MIGWGLEYVADQKSKQIIINLYMMTLTIMGQ